MDTVQVEHGEVGLVTLTLNDPDKLNAMGEAMTTELLAAVEGLARPDQGIRCLLVTGAGRGFCAGGSLDWMAEGREADEPRDHGISLGTHHHRIMRLLRDMPFPVVTAVNGPAAGLGFSYALAGDLVLASRSAFFTAAFAKIGVSPDGGLSWLLPRIVGWARAKELLLTSARIDAETALEWGLVNRVFDDATFREEALAVARELAAGPTLALGVTRKLLWDGWANSHDAQLDLEESLQPQTFASRDAREGGMAMAERRAPNFTGN